MGMGLLVLGVAGVAITTSGRRSVAPPPAVTAPPPPAATPAPVVELPAAKPVLPVVQRVPPPAPPHRPARHAKRTTTSVKRVTEKPAPEGMGYLTVNAEPWGQVVVDGLTFAHHTPVFRAPIAAGRHSVTVFNPVRKAAAPKREVLIEPGKTLVMGFDW
jgi:hypothetical protein